MLGGTVGTRGPLGDVRGFEISSSTDHDNGPVDVVAESAAQSSERSSKKKKKKSQKPPSPTEALRTDNTTCTNANSARSSPAPPIRTPPKPVASKRHLLESFRPSSTRSLRLLRNQADVSPPHFSTASNRCPARKHGLLKVRTERRPKLEHACSLRRTDAADQTTRSVEMVFTSSREATEWVRLIKDAIHNDRISQS